MWKCQNDPQAVALTDFIVLTANLHTKYGTRVAINIISALIRYSTNLKLLSNLLSHIISATLRPREITTNFDAFFKIDNRVCL
jgi:hypothetical protein